MIVHNINDYCFTEEGEIFLLTSIIALVKDKRTYWIIFRKNKDIEVNESVYNQVYAAIKERDRLVREWINNNIEGRYNNEKYRND